MAAQTPPYVIQASSHSAELFRRELQAGMAAGGIVSPTDLAVTANGTPNMSVNVAAGQVLVPGTLGSSAGLPSGFTSQGTYYAYNDATVNLAVAASNPTNPRIDIVVATVQDAQYAGASNNWVLQVITGTPAVSPVVPAAPANSIIFAQVAVAANATTIVSGNITDVRPPARVLGQPAVHFRGHRTAAWNSTATPAVFGMDTEDWDSANAYSTGTGLFTCPVAGYYKVSIQNVVTSTAATQANAPKIYHNGSVAVSATSAFSTASGEALTGATSDTFKCAAGDTLAMGIAATTTLAGITGSANTFVSIDLIGVL
jgi:hypothetical protein